MKRAVPLGLKITTDEEIEFAAALAGLGSREEATVSISFLAPDDNVMEIEFVGRLDGVSRELRLPSPREQVVADAVRAANDALDAARG